MKIKSEENLFLGFLGFLQLVLISYLVIGVIFYLVTSNLIIPYIFTEYISVIYFLPFIYLLFLGRVIVSSLINWMLIVGERTMIGISHMIFVCFQLFQYLYLIFMNQFHLQFSTKLNYRNLFSNNIYNYLLSCKT